MINKHTSIKHKLAFSFISVAMLLTAMIFIVVIIAFFPSILKREAEDIEKTLFRATNTLKQEVINLGHLANDWAYWDDSYNYLAGKAPNYEQSNLNDEALRSAGVSFINLTNLDGEIVWGRYFKPENNQKSYSGAPTLVGTWPEQFIDRLTSAYDEFDGYFLSEFGTFFFSARPVLTSSRKGPVQGWFIVGRWLSHKFTHDFTTQMQLPMAFAPADASEVALFHKLLPNNIAFHINKLSFTQIRAKALVFDYKGDPAFTLTIDEARIGFIDSLIAIITALLGLIFVGAFCTWFGYRQVRERVVDPLSELAESMEKLGYQDRQLPLPTINNGDEITLLYRKYHQMAKRLMRTQQALKERSAMLEEEALTDPLTKLHNRRYLERLMARVSGNVLHDPSQRKLLLAIDIDNFKTLNDTYGHVTGDTVLLQLASILQSIFREQDHIIRTGGEEFLVVAACQGECGCRELAERIRARVAEAKFGSDLSKPLTVTVSIGFAWFPLRQSPLSTEKWQTVLELADNGLYKSKMTGRNTWYGYYAEPTITDSQLDLLPDGIEQLIESKALRQVTLQSKTKTKTSTAVS